jgi:hypothetical protein
MSYQWILFNILKMQLGSGCTPDAIVPRIERRHASLVMGICRRVLSHGARDVRGQGSSGQPHVNHRFANGVDLLIKHVVPNTVAAQQNNITSLKAQAVGAGAYQERERRGDGLWQSWATNLYV